MIEILLAARNGEKYIAEQIESVLAQSEKNLRLIIQDDCSADKTAEIAAEYAKKYPDKVKLYRRSAPSGSAKANFMDMLRLAESDYIMFSDQDDVWLPYKAEKSIRAMNELENQYGKNLPLLVHGDLLVVDDKLNATHNSMFSYQGLDSRAKTLNKLYVQNNVTGCSMMINRRLMELASEASPDEMLMHDWWFALIAASMGKIGFIDKPLVKYRQHGDNQLGAVNNRTLNGIVNAVHKQQEMKGRISITFEQAAAFYARYGERMPSDSREISEYYLSIPLKSKPERIFSLISHGFLKQNFMAATGQIIFC